MENPDLVRSVDPIIFGLVEGEERRQEETLMMIPSENHPSKAVEAVVGSMLGSKYSEGYPGARYYQGQEYVDKIENEAINRAKELFGVPHVNVQPYSGSPANLAVLTALAIPEGRRGRIMGLTLEAGGHLTHGAQASATSTYFDSTPYTVGEDGFIDYDRLAQLAQNVQPDILIAGTTAYPRILDWKRFADIAEKSGSLLMADMSHVAGLVAGDAYPSPINHADIVTTTTHKTLRGPRGAMILVTEKGLGKDPEMGRKIDKEVFPGLQGGPHMNSIAAIAVALREAQHPNFKEYAKQTVQNAQVLAGVLTGRGFDLVTGGTDSHLILADLRQNGLSGRTVAVGLEAAGIVTNRNAVPFDKAPNFSPSGLRLGTPGITSRGMKEPEMITIGNMIADITQGLVDYKTTRGIADNKMWSRSLLRSNIPAIGQSQPRVLELCRRFPIPASYTS